MKNYQRGKLVFIFAIIFAAIAATALAFSYFTDRSNSTASLFTSTFDDNGYSITLESEEGYQAAGDTVEITLKESNNKTENIVSEVSMLVAWDSPAANSDPWGIEKNNIEVRMGDKELAYTVNADNSLSIALPKHSLSSGTSDAVRKLTFQIPAATTVTGTLYFSVESVDLKQDPHGWDVHYDNSDLSDLIFDVGVVWDISANAQSALPSEANMDVIAFLSEGSGTDKYSLNILKNGDANNTNGGAMMDWSDASQTPWANYTITSLFLADGVTSIGAHAFDGTDLSGEITIPASIGEIGKLAFGNLPNVTTFTFEQDTSSSLSLPDNKTEGAETKGAFYAGTSYTEVSPLHTKVNTTNKDVLAYAWNKDGRGYTVTVTDVTGVTVTADPATAVNGQTISLKVTPDTGYKYKGSTVTWPEGSQNLAADEMSFTMPTADVTVTVSVDHSVQYISTVPTQSGSLTYKGSEQSPPWSSFDDMQLAIGGTTSATNAGTYTATFTPKDGYAWSDGSTEPKSVTWTINKADPNLTVGSTSTSTETGIYTDISFSRRGTGTVSASSNKTSVATATISGSNVRISGVGAGSATITVKVAATTNYNAASKTISVSVTTPTPGTLAANYSWYKGATERTSLKTINIVDSYTPAGAVTESWNADVDNVGKIKCYVEGTTLTIAGNGTGKIIANADSSHVFSLNPYGSTQGFIAATAINGLTLLDTSNVTTMAGIFWGCNKVTELDLSSFITSKVTNMDDMFWDCLSLKTLDLSNFDTGNVEHMRYLFLDCNALTSLDVSSFDVSKVKDFDRMFQNCDSLTTLDLSSFVTSSATNMSYMFDSCDSLQTLIIDNFDTSEVTNMFSMFAYCDSLVDLDVSGFDTGKVKTMEKLFYNCKRLPTLDLTNFNTSNVTNMDSMFYYCRGLTELDVSSFDTSNVKDMKSMFNNCEGLTTIDVSNFNTSKVTDMGSMFSSSDKLTSLDLSNFDTSSVTDMSGMFFWLQQLESITFGEQFVTDNVTDMGKMFYCGYKLSSLDLSNFRTGNVTDMNYMFYAVGSDADSFTLDISNFDTSNVTTMSGMFMSCNKLKSLNLAHFNTAKVTTMSNMFNQCTSLSYLDIRNFDTRGITDSSGLEHFGRSTSFSTLKLGPNFGQTEILPAPGEETGLFYHGSPVKAYGANAAIKAYDWAGDNRSVTFMD